MGTPISRPRSGFKWWPQLLGLRVVTLNARMEDSRKIGQGGLSQELS